MRIAAYQFPVSGNIAENLRRMLGAVRRASAQQTELLIFPECAVTGYPPGDIESAAAVDAAAVREAERQLRAASDGTGVALIAGTIGRENGRLFNRAVLYRPGCPPAHYDKRLPDFGEKGRVFISDQLICDK